MAIRYPRGNVLGLDPSEERAPIKYGSWEVLEEGNDIVLISYGPTLQMLTEAATTLKDLGINAKVINARFIKPLDFDCLDQLGANSIPIFVIEEAMLTGGLGSMIASYFTDNKYRNTIQRLGIDNEYIEHGDVDLLLNDIGISVENIVNKSRRIVEDSHEKNAN